MKNKKGFTLLELCVAVALSMMIVTLTTTYIVMYNGKSAEVTANSDTITEINEIKVILNQWTKVYGTDKYDISMQNGNSVEGYREVKAENLSGGYTYILRFENNKLIQEKVENGTKTSSEIELNMVDNMCFFWSGEKNSVLKCSISFADNSTFDAQNLLYPILSKTSRERYTIASRG